MKLEVKAQRLVGEHPHVRLVAGALNATPWAALVITLEDVKDLKSMAKSLLRAINFKAGTWCGWKIHYTQKGAA